MKVCGLVRLVAARSSRSFGFRRRRMLSTQIFSSFLYREEDFFSLKRPTWLTGNRSYFIFIADISSAPQASFVSMPRTNPGCNAPVQGCFCLGALKETRRVLFHQWDSGASQAWAALVLSLCWKGRAGYFKDILRLCSSVAEFQSERRIHFTSTCCSSGLCDILTFPS